MKQIIKTYKVLPEYWDLWGAYEGSDTVTYDEIKQCAKDWEMDIESLLAQVEEIKEETTMKGNEKQIAEKNGVAI